MLRVSDKRRLENELASTMQEVALAMLLDSDSEPEEDLDSESKCEEDSDSDYDLLGTLVPAHDAIYSSRYLDRGTHGSAGQLPIDDAISEYLKYPDQSFVVDFRMYRESFLVLVNLLHKRG